MDTLVAETTDWLESDGAQASIERNAYWPKWHSPWWRLLLLHEMGYALPSATVKSLARAVDRQCIHDFPVDGEPEGVDGYREIMCHCGMGSLYQMIGRAGLDVDRVLPWAREWFVRYQMADGGWNCDDEAYRRTAPRSSIQSTLPMLEALLGYGRELSEAEATCLDRGAAYLLSRRLHMSLSRGKVMDPAFLEPVFPRYYDYDVLRGLAFVVAWAQWRERSLRRADLQEALDAMAARCDASGSVLVTRDALRGETTLAMVDGVWTRRQPVGTFPLLEAVNRPGEASPWLTLQWCQVQAGLQHLESAGLLA